MTSPTLWTPQDPTPVQSKDLGGACTQNVQVGTIRWQWEDDQGMVHDHTILDSYYILDGQVHLLSPQHWMQKTMTKQERSDHSHFCITKHNHILLTWKDKFVWTIPLDNSNVGTFTLALGYKNFEAFDAKTHIILEDEDDHPILLTNGGNMWISGASQTTMSRHSRNVQSKSTSTCKGHCPSSSSLMN